jgi:hypothetical protein
MMDVYGRPGVGTAESKLWIVISDLRALALGLAIARSTRRSPQQACTGADEDWLSSSDLKSIANMLRRHTSASWSTNRSSQINSVVLTPIEPL